MGPRKTRRWIAVAIAALVSLGVAVAILSGVTSPSCDTAASQFVEHCAHPETTPRHAAHAAAHRLERSAGKSSELGA